MDERQKKHQEEQLLLQACLRISRQPDLMPFTKYLQQELDTAKERLVDSSGDQDTRRLQGKAACLREILNLLESSQHLLSGR